MKKKIACKACKARTTHKMIVDITMVTKWRTISITTYQCSECLTLKQIQHETKNKKVCQWD